MATSTAGGWSAVAAAALEREMGPAVSRELAQRVYSSRLLGEDPSLCAAGGGNTSVKLTETDLLGREVPVLRVKASGVDLAGIGPESFPALDLSALRELSALPSLAEEELENVLLQSRFRHLAPRPSIEALAHAFLPPRFVDHTHAEAVLGLTNLSDGEQRIRAALGEKVAVIPYTAPGLALARATLAAYQPGLVGMVWMGHGLVTWGETAEESYRRMMELVAMAEKALPPLPPFPPPPAGDHRRRAAAVLPLLRGVLAAEAASGPLLSVTHSDPATLSLLADERAQGWAASPAPTSDHLVRTGAFPLWVELPGEDDPYLIRRRLSEALARHRTAYREYLGDGEPPFPRAACIPGVGVVGLGRDAASARTAADLLRRALLLKVRASALGPYRGLSREECRHAETRALQVAKVPKAAGELAGKVALVTGAAGAIGTGICEGLLAAGCHVAATDLPGEGLERLERELGNRFPGRVLALPLDVTDPASVKGAFDLLLESWGGVDIGVVNAGLAHVATLSELSLEDFRRLEKVNVEGTLLVLAELGRRFALQQMGGDVILVSTKNVFAPGAGFGAYSATKAAAHQLARIASLELAPLGVRVNMVAPDAVFSHGAVRSGLWQEVGPGRMKARGLDEKGLEEYYRSRNLLKVSVTAAHVAEAVLFFATRRTPTTGATLPVDGGLPDATPR